MTSGGKRPGAGRPVGSTTPGGRKKSLTIRITREERAKAEKIGNGNATEGIRRAIEAFKNDGRAKYLGK